MSEEVKVEVKGKKVVVGFVGIDLLVNILEGIAPATVRDINTLGKVMRDLREYTDKALEKFKEFTDFAELKKAAKDFPKLTFELTEEQFRRIKEKIKFAFDQKNAVVLNGKLEEIEELLAQFDLSE